MSATQAPTAWAASRTTPHRATAEARCGDPPAGVHATDAAPGRGESRRRFWDLTKRTKSRKPFVCSGFRQMPRSFSWSTFEGKKWPKLFYLRQLHENRPSWSCCSPRACQESQALYLPHLSSFSACNLTKTWDQQECMGARTCKEVFRGASAPELLFTAKDGLHLHRFQVQVAQLVKQELPIETN